MLRIKPLRELETLRFDERRAAPLTLESDTTHRLQEISGDTLEIQVVIEPGATGRFGLQVYGDPEGHHGFPIAFEPEKKSLMLGETSVPFELQPGENLELRVFLDKSLIEVFVNDRQAALAPHRYAPENLQVSLFSRGRAILVREVKAWKMRSIYTP